MADYNKIGLLIFKDDRILLCRKNRMTSKLILPGGCLEPGEAPMACLARELREELGDVRADGIEYVGSYEAIAASDDPAVQKTLRIELYQGGLAGEPVPSSEIIELVWFGPDSNADELSPILAGKILPDLRRKGLFPR